MHVIRLFVCFSEEMININLDLYFKNFFLDLFKLTRNFFLQLRSCNRFKLASSPSHDLKGAGIDLRHFAVPHFDMAFSLVSKTCHFHSVLSTDGRVGSRSRSHVLI